MKYRRLNFLLGGCILLFIIPFALYFSQFHNGFGSHAEFGTFGDFINPFLSSINILLLIYITYYVQRKEESKSKEVLQAQFEQNLMMLRHEAYKEIVEFLNGIDKQKITEENYDDLTSNYRAKLNHYFRDYSHLFSFLKSDEGIKILYCFGEDISLFYRNSKKGIEIRQKLKTQGVKVAPFIEEEHTKRIMRIIHQKVEIKKRLQLELIGK